MSLLQEAKRWAEFLEIYGQPSEISDEEAAQLPREYVWSLWSRGNDFLTNEFSQADEVFSHWRTPKPWSGDEGGIHYTMTIWVDCPTCSNMSAADEDWDPDNCDECEGAGTLSIELEDCVDAKSEQEVFDSRRAS